MGVVRRRLFGVRRRFDPMLSAPLYSTLRSSGSSSVVEHRLAKARVASSNLVSRSNSPSGAGRVGYGEVEHPVIGCPAKARYPSGKGEVCKTFMRRFDPGPRLQLLQPDLPLVSLVYGYLKLGLPVL